MTYVLGARLVLERVRSRMLFVVSILSIGLIALVALLERSHGVAPAVELTLTGAVFGVVLPLFSYAAFEAALEHGAWAPALAPMARHGLSRPALARGVSLTLLTGVALASAFFAVLGVSLSRAPSDPALVRDLVAVSWIAALTGAAYVGIFAFGSLLRRGRLWLLILDWLLGSGTGLLAVPWPRGHARNLLGYAPVLDTSQAAAALALALVAVVGIMAGTRHLAR